MVSSAHQLHKVVDNASGINTRGINAKRERQMHRFWLDTMIATEQRLDTEIKALKKHRLFAKTVRDGLRLVLDLKAGNLDVLIELFPFVYDRMKADILTDMVSAPAMPRPLGKVIPMSSPLDDDDDVVLDIKQAEGAGQASASNFLQSAFNLVQ